MRRKSLAFECGDAALNEAHTEANSKAVCGGSLGIEGSSVAATAGDALLAADVGVRAPATAAAVLLVRAFVSVRLADAGADEASDFAFASARESLSLTFSSSSSSSS